MTLKRAALAAALLLAPLALAQEPTVLARVNGILVEDGYARAIGANAPTAAVYMRITNDADTDDRLLAVRTEAAARAELHAHQMQDGIARMRPVDSITIPAHGTTVLETGGLHVMLMGLAAPLPQGGDVAVTLVFERAGEVPVTLPVDLGGGGSGHAHGGG